MDARGVCKHPTASIALEVLHERAIGREHPQTSDRETRGKDRSRNGYTFTATIETDDPAELKYNAVLWPLRGLAEKQMADQDIALVPDYALVITGLDAAEIVRNVLTAIEIEVRLDDGTDRRTNRVPVAPGDFSLDQEQKAFRLQNPVDLEHLIRGDGRYGEPWPDTYTIGVRLFDRNGTSILPAWADS